MKRCQALVFVVAVLAAGCGVRVNSTLRRQAANAQLGVGASTSGGQAGSQAASPGAAGAAPGGDVTGGGTGPAGASTGGSGPASASASGPQSQIPSASAPAGGNGGATDVGVTADSILLGNVSDLSGPVPGIFQGAVTGTLAYLNYVNSQGGVFGRQLKLQSSDSQTECAQTENAYSGLVNKVFAFVGSFGLYDDCGSQVLSQHPDVAAVQYMLSGKGVSLPNDFSVEPALPGHYATGPFLYYKAKFADAVQKVGSLWSNIPSAISSVSGINAAAQSVGWKFIYTRAIGATESNFTTDIVRMQSDGVKLVFLVGVTAQVAATLVDEAQQQNWHPIFVLPIAYAQNFMQLVGGAQAAEGIYGFNLYSLFFNTDDAKNIPELALYQQWMQKTDASQPEDLYSMYGWAEAALFVQALRAAGPRATRASEMAALRTIHSFSDNGVVGAADPAGKVATHCYTLWTIHNGRYGRLDTPPNAFRCDGSLYGG